MSSETERARPKNPQRDNSYTAFDRALISASREGQVVHFQMVNGEHVKGLVTSVDKFQVELEIDSTFKPYREWFNKSLIVRTRIEK